MEKKKTFVQVLSKIKEDHETSKLKVRLLDGTEITGTILEVGADHLVIQDPKVVSVFIPLSALITFQEILA